MTLETTIIDGQEQFIEAQNLRIDELKAALRLGFDLAAQVPLTPQMIVQVCEFRRDAGKLLGLDIAGNEVKP